MKSEMLTRQLGLLVDLLAEMAGPLRHQATELWLSASGWYGRTGADRGLATGEIVEEFQYLRQLLIRHLSELMLVTADRHTLTTILRLNRGLDQGIAHAVVGYTDALVESLLNERGIPIRATGSPESDLEQRMQQFELDVAVLRAGHERDAD